MKIKARQFDSTEAIELFLAEKDDGTLDNIYENIYDEVDGEASEAEAEAYTVKAFNKSMNSLAELIS
jgi:hypothetical protein